MGEFWHNAKKVIILALPIMLGSAGQNIIALTDSLFLYRYDENDFAAVGFASVFYLVIAAIAFGFSKGVQILSARKYGEKSIDFVKKYFWATIIFEAAIGLVVFVLLFFFAREILNLFINSEIILQKSLDFLKYRALGIPFSYIGLGLVAFYLGISKPRFIFIDTIVLAVANFVLCYALVFGKFGFAEMGIAGAGLASSIAEAIAFVVFIGLMIFDRDIKIYNLLKIPKIEIQWVKTIIRLSTPILLQSMIGIGSWFIFFSLIEKFGEHNLAISNLLRVVYLVLSIPCWGFGTAINSIVSNTIGKGKERRVLKQVFHSSIVSLVFTSVFAIPTLLFANVILEPLLGKADSSLFQDSIVYLHLLFPIILLYSVSTVFFNGVSGTGETIKCLQIQFISSLFYLGITYVSTIYPIELGLYVAWASELVYWSIQLVMSYLVLKSGSWNFIKF
ncbi:MAG: MATE family efflux transporter [Saprospiraceae bacterium]|nr:MATE family efflux transporter [Saprospiraceae bacterium]